MITMARHLNDVKLLGNLTRDPELRYTPSNTAVCELGLAVNRSYQDNDGEWQDDTTFVDITVWGNNGENAEEYLSKGSKVFIDGRLNFESWESDGERQSKLSVTADNVIFLDSNSSNGDAENAEDILNDFDGGESNEDIPF
jgi:single-strand DNA-binding protein